MPHDRMFIWPQSRQTSPRNRTTGIAIHCTATREGQDIDAHTVDQWHLKQGWAGIGYHFLIGLDGTLEAGRPENSVGSGIFGFNAELIHIVYVGGLDRQGRPKDTRTDAQKRTMVHLVRHLKAKHRATLKKIGGHRDWSPDKDGDGVVEQHEWLKACPCFDVAAWLISDNV
jgi:hypothetical protein